MADKTIEMLPRAHRHAKRALIPEVAFHKLKPRFSPTAIFSSETTPTTTSTVNAVPTTTQTSASSVTTPKATTTSANTQTASQTIQTQTTTSTSVSSTSTSTASSTTATSSIPTTTSTTSSAVVIATPTSTPSTAQSTFITTTFRSVAPANSVTGTSASASATASAAPSNGMSTTGIIGIAAASVVGVSILAGVAMYFLRRWNRQRDEEYNPDDFRRQSVVIPDEAPSTLYRGNSGGRPYGSNAPRPPTMLERHYLNLSTPQPPNMAYQPPQHFGMSSAFGDYSPTPVSMPSFSPGEIISPVSPGPGSPPPQGSQYANVPSSFYNPMGQSPVASPVSVAPYGSAYDDQGRLIRSPSTAGVTLTRGNSVVNGLAQYVGPDPPSMPENDYIDATRASVTPYQAEQYAAISRQLNIPPPVPLHSLSEEQAESHHNLEPKPVVDSPFIDHQENAAYNQPSRPSSEFQEHDKYAVSDVPPPRVPSVAPMLPDIQLQQRAFSPLSFPVSPSPMRATFGVDANAPPVARPDLPPLSPVASSPRRAQFVQNETCAHDGRETPVEIGFFENSSAMPTSQAMHQQTSTTATGSAEKKRPDTLYDDEDAYGGL